MSDVYSLRARLSEEQARNRELRSCVAELEMGVTNAERHMSDYRNKVQNTLTDSANKINMSHENIVRSHEVLNEINKMYVRFKNMELANKKIRECNNKKYYDFANYTTVRKIVQGMLDNLNVNMISDSIIYKAIEKEHLKTPDYWLTSVLISIMAWKNDDPELAERATEISVKLDKKNSSIFYMLFNIRMRREEAALKWFFVYQECELKGSDEKTFLMLFSLLCKTLQDEIEDKVKYEIIDFINKVIAMNAQSEGFSEEEILDKIEMYYKRMKDSDKLQLNMLKRCLVDYSEVAETVILAENNINILQFIMDVGNVSEMEKNEYLDQFINDEIAKPNEVEISVYNEIEYNELVIACNGDMETTEKIYNERQLKKSQELNLISEMIDWIYRRDAEDEVNGQARKNMFTLTLSLQTKAIEQYIEHYRKRVKSKHPAVIGDYNTEVNFHDRAEESNKIQTYYESERETQLSQIKYTVSIVGAILAVAGIVGIFFMGVGSIVLSVIGVIMVVYNVLSNNKQKKHIMETCLLNIKNKNELMDQLFSEYETMKKQYEEYDSYAERIEEVMNQF
ncbi:MAG: DUF308 domain-containing protein [Tyzzerella sp.]|nr:DUF308 domain-containing protein [Tyzzerella sp.]